MDERADAGIALRGDERTASYPARWSPEVAACE
jgi:hypothetical protein